MTRHRPDGLPHYDTVVINCRIPSALHAKLKLLLLDPTTGKVRPRGWSMVIEEGMKLWLARQQHPQATTSPVHTAHSHHRQPRSTRPHA